MDWVGFKKLFKVPIPVEEHAEYYIETLARSPQYAYLPDLVEGFKEFEARCLEGVRREKLQTLDRLVEYLKETEAYAKLQVWKHLTVASYDNRHSFSQGEWLVGLDLKTANFSV